MNLRGSYRRLMGNAKAAIIAAIEIYNKPRFDYRDECFVILLLNAWELLLKAILSKNKQSIFYPKKKNQPYRTLSLVDALVKVQDYFPPDVDYLSVRENLRHLTTYRDNAVHFYNKAGFEIIVYALAQTSIVNFRDLLLRAFNIDLADEITIKLLPIGLSVPIDPVEYIRRATSAEGKTTKAVKQFIHELAKTTQELEKVGADTGRLLTVFSVKLESTKKISNADVVAGVEKADTGTGPLLIERKSDPNITHPLRQKEIIEQVKELHGIKFTQFTFQALIYKYKIKEKSLYCWIAKEGNLIRYSRDLVAFIKRLSEKDIRDAVSEYKEFLAERKKRGSVRSE